MQLGVENAELERNVKFIMSWWQYNKFYNFIGAYKNTYIQIITKTYMYLYMYDIIDITVILLLPL